MKVSSQLNAVYTNMKQVSGIIPIWVDVVRSRWSVSLIISGIHFFRKTCHDKFSTAHFSLSRKSRLGKIIINYAKHSQNILNVWSLTHIKQNQLFPAVCDILHQEGAGAEVVSAFELLLAKKPGVPSSKILMQVSLPLTLLH